MPQGWIAQFFKRFTSHRSSACQPCESEALQAAIIDAALEAIITIDEAGDIVAWNPSATRIFGYPCADVLGQSLTEVIVPPYMRQCHQEGLHPYLTTGESHLLGQRIESVALRADGEVFPVELAVHDVRLATGRVFTAYIRDISERKRMELELRDNEQRFRSIAEVHPVPVVIAGIEEARLLYASPGMAKLFGAPVSELIGRKTQICFVRPEDRLEMRAKLLDEGSIDSYEFVMRRYDGSTVPVAITARRIVYDGMDAAVGGIIDLTERKHAEEEIARQREALHQSEKLSALGSLLAGVAHELNNPLSVVVGRAIMLEVEAHDPETVTAAGKIRQAAERCTRIIKTFLAMARQQQPERAPVQLHNLIAAALDLVGYGLRTAGVEVRLDLAPDLPDLLADAAQLQQVFSNLLVNAQQALLEAPEPRQLRITTSHEQASNTLRVVVSDNGPGVHEHVRSRIFDPFFTTKPVGMGTGIGLSLSHGIVSAHGGTITLENPPEGGARFVVALPLVTAEPSVEADTGEENRHAESHTILIVDDEPEVADMLSDILRRAGHRTAIAPSGNVALADLAVHDYDLLLSDLHMPDLNGMDLYRHLQTSHPYLLERIIFITGDSLGTTVRSFLAETGRPYLEKPFMPSEVLHLVHQLLRQSHAPVKSS